jgi:hypothetical protein
VTYFKVLRLKVLDEKREKTSQSAHSIHFLLI